MIESGWDIRNRNKMALGNENKESGFSLVELIASLTIAGILAVALMTIVVTAMNGFSLSREAAGITQKANLALARLRIELLNAEDISTAEDNRLVYIANNGTYEILRSGTTITLEKTDAPTIAAKTLVDNIAADYGTDKFLTFEKQDTSVWLTSDDFSELHAIKVKLKFSDYHADLDTLINPRENRVRNAPLLVLYIFFQPNHG
jgi:prepilin-type N-terminal cleavage/methylation domain-containing protein